MNRAEAEKLLGGYATGTLSEAERKTLFAAALEDQELFNTLADEEALRELLEDPAVREQLLKALAPKVTPFWRRPAVLSAAAGLLVAVGGSLVVYRSNVTAPPIQRAEEAKPQAPAEKQAAPKTAERQEAPKAAEKESRAAAVQPPPPPASPSPSKPMEEDAKALVAKDASHDRLDAAIAGLKQPEPAKPVTAEATAPAPPAPALLARKKEAKADAFQSGKAGAAAGALGGVSGGLASGVAAQQAEKTESAPSSINAVALADRSAGMGYAKEPLAPSWTLVGGRPARLRVHWDGRGSLYLLRRAGAKAVSIPAASSTPAAGMVDTVFLADLAEADALDLYRTDGPVARPEALPAEGPVEGFRARVWPPKK